jgi:diguanylate cyclase (GGDEF)-like protein/PAS domain S-box-containing protein
MVAALLIVFGFLHSVSGFFRCLEEIRSLRQVDVETLSVEGEVQFQIQESRQRFLRILMPAAGFDTRVKDIDLVRAADLRVDLLKARVIALTGEKSALGRFERSWRSYVETRDDMIARALRGQFAEAVAIDKSRGAAAFDRASEELRGDKREREMSSRQRTYRVETALRNGCFEALWLLLARVLFVAALFVADGMRRRMLRQLRSAAGTLYASEQRFRHVFEDATVAMLIMDLEGRITSVNKAVTEITGFSDADLIGRIWKMFLAEDHRDASAGDFAEVVAGRLSGYRAERRLARKDGRFGWIRSSVSLLRKDGVPSEVIALCEDITAQKLAGEQLAYQASHDSLTGLVNRRHFEGAVDSAVNSAGRDGTELALLYIDLNGFKAVNDTFGHAAGDLLLCEVASRMRNCLRAPELLGRVGGDEFAVLQPFTRGNGGLQESAEALARKLRASLDAPFSLLGSEVNIEASIGISRFPADGADADALLRTADAAMYHGKRGLNSGLCFFDADLRASAHRRQSLESRMRSGLEQGEFDVRYQPLYDLATNTLVRFEALCRWNSDVLGEVSPSEFIPVAEGSGLISEVGRWVLERACEQALLWQCPGEIPVRIAVNVSARQFADAGYVESVRQVLCNTGLRPDLLELELTESTLVIDHDDSVRKMKSLRQLGISISVDDFGTGYSSLSCLQLMPIDALKIDRSFTRMLDCSPAATSVIRSVIAMARALGLRVVTEGVETAAQLDTVRRLGSDEVQGYYTGAPEDAAAARRRVLNERARYNVAIPA